MAATRYAERHEKCGSLPAIGKNAEHGGLGPTKYAAKSFASSSVSELEEEDVKLKLEDQLTNNKLKELQQIFEEADEDGGGGLDIDEFRTAMRKAMGEHLTDHDLEIIFMKVDTNCDGTVDWDEYLSYMLLEYRGKDHMNLETQSKLLPKQIKKAPHTNLYHQRHDDSVIGLTLVQSVTKTTDNLFRTVDDNSGRYLSLTNEGVVNFWNAELQHLKSFHIRHSIKFQRNISVWVTAFAYMPNVNMLCVATTSSNLTFYELTANKFSPMLTIESLEICATCMDYWVNPDRIFHSKLVWGDARGNVSGIAFDNCQAICFLQPSTNKHFRSKITFKDVLQGKTCGVAAYKLKNVHEDYVLKIRYIPSLNSFLSCCRGRNTSLCQGDLEGKKTTYFKVWKGVFAFDYCPKNNVLVTGGKDTVVRVWNPYAQSKPVMVLQGHKSAVIYVIVNDVKEQIIGISEDKEINIFDMSTQTCIQTIFRKWVQLGPMPISAAYFNQGRQTLLLATNQLSMFERREEEIKTHQLTSHGKPVTVCLYNSLFNQVVSGGKDSMVCVWDVDTGERIIQFLAHTKTTKGGEEINVQISAMTFDPTKRRLITAFRDGAVKVWNFNNGACLRELETFDSKEITGLLLARQRIVTAGWNQKITVYVDSSEDETVVHWQPVHKEDIHVLALLSPGTIASASYDGDIFVWTLDSGNAVNLFNASESAQSIFMSCRLKSAAAKRVSKEGEREEEVAAAPCMGDHGDGAEKVTKDGSPEGSEQSEPKEESASGQDNHSQKSKLDEIGEQNEDVKKFYGPQLEGKDDIAERVNNGKSVEALIFLRTREVSRTSANLVSAGVEGWIRFWSIRADGGLLGQFHGGHQASSTITCLVTDAYNEFLVTGDSDGYIKVWDIAQFCIDPSQPEVPKEVQDRRNNFVQLDDQLCIQQWREAHKKVPGPPPCTNPGKTWRDPPLLTSFRAHLLGVSYMDYIETEDKLVSCSGDCSIRLWTVYGEFIGIFGQEVPWNLAAGEEQKSTSLAASVGRVKQAQSAASQLRRQCENFRKARANMVHKLPSDIRRVASATTMRVMCGGVRPHWKLAKNILTVWVPMMKLSRKTEHPELDFLDNIMTSPSEPFKLPVLPLEPPTSEILGKNFKAQRKHQVMPDPPKLRHFNNQCDVYSSLPFHDLAPINSDIQPPQCLVEMRERQKNIMQATRKTRTLFKMGTVFGKAVNKTSHEVKRKESKTCELKGSQLVCDDHVSKIQ